MKADFFKIKKSNYESITLSLEIPEADEEYANGLAFRDSIPQNTGMIYNMYPETETGMYTPDTRIPVDFIFIDCTGTIIKIHHNAKPLCRDIINCYQTRYVIELAGGECKRLGIEVGDVLVLNNEKEKELFISPDTLNGIFYISTGTYFCKTPDKLYMYSCRTHLWDLIEEKEKWCFYERNIVLECINNETLLTAKFAKENCIKRDMELLNDLKQNLKYYYKLSDYLFIVYDYQDNSFKYYDFNKGWAEIEDIHSYPLDSNVFYTNTRWFSIVQTKKEVDEAINDIKNNAKKKELSKIDKENEEKLNKLKYKMYPFCKVFYKDDDVEGWKGAVVPGSKIFAQMQCEKFRSQKNWKDFYIFEEDNSYRPINIEFDADFTPELLYSTPTWQYHPETNRYFILPDEKLPLPKNKAKKARKLDFWVDYDKEDDPETASLILNIKSGKDVCYIDIKYSCEKDKIKQFFENVRNGVYAQLIINSYLCNKIFVWNVNDKIRFQVQDWGYGINISFDIEYPKDDFIEFINKLEKEIDKIVKNSKKP